MDTKFSPKDFKRIVDACRKSGVVEFKGHGVEFKLGPALPSKPKKVKEIKYKDDFERAVAEHTAKQLEAQQKADEAPTDTPTENELLFWSSGGTDESDDNEGLPV